MPLHYAVLASVSRCYSPLKGRLLTCYSPVRHFISFPKESLIVRLACLRHAASVDSEPGSNSRWFLSHLFSVRNSSDVSEQTEVCRTCSYLRINTWTYISSFQRSTFIAFSFPKRNYRLYRSDSHCQAHSETFLTFSLFLLKMFLRGKYVIYRLAIALSSGRGELDKKIFLIYPLPKNHVLSKNLLILSGVKNGPLIL